MAAYHDPYPNEREIEDAHHRDRSRVDPAAPFDANDWRLTVVESPRPDEPWNRS